MAYAGVRDRTPLVWLLEREAHGMAMTSALKRYL